MNRESKERAAAAASQAATLANALNALCEQMRVDESVSLDYLVALVRERDRVGRLDAALRRRMRDDFY